jgi:hypothetical protein
MIPKPRMAALVSVLVLFFAAAVYLLTLTPTVPFWDSGEFIAVAKILGVPHPPGTPFYVLLARIATLVPWASVAQRVNALSAISAALTVWLTYLTSLRLVRLAQGPERQPWHEWVAVAAAGVGALMLAFSDAFWENSVEAEVYQMMSLAQVLVFWLGLRWWEAHDKKPTVGPLLLATYVMWLCVGLHLGVGTMGAPLLLLVALVDRPVALLFVMPFLTLLRVPAGLEHMAGAVIVLSAITAFVLVWKRKLEGWVAIAGAAVSIPGFMAANSDTNFTPFSATATAVGVIGPMAWMAFKGQREGRVLLLALFLMVVGYSTHLYLPIRAAQHPGVNAAPRSARSSTRSSSATCAGSGSWSDRTTTTGCRRRAARTPGTRGRARGSGTSSTTCGSCSRRGRSCRWRSGCSGAGGSSSARRSRSRSRSCSSASRPWA